MLVVAWQWHPWYKLVQAKYILPLVKEMPDLMDSDYANYLLSVNNQTITQHVAKFCATCYCIRKEKII
ncbi:UNVERIFIED_CONTAM: hypothetical protein K2H54_067567 [Gekko kuhli]